MNIDQAVELLDAIEDYALAMETAGDFRIGDPLERLRRINDEIDRTRMVMYQLVKKHTRKGLFRRRVKDSLPWYPTK